MAKQHTDTQFNKDEFTRIFDEYRNKIEAITRSTEANLQSLQIPPRPDLNDQPEDQPAGEPPDTPVAAESAAEEAPELRVEDEPDADKVEDEPEPPAPVIPPSTPLAEAVASPEPVTESAKTIKEAQKMARQIIAQAEEQVKKEARKKIQAQADKYLANAQKEAEEIISQARELVDKERDATVAATRGQVEELLREITDQARQETQAQSSRAIEESRLKAEKLMADVINGSSEISRLVGEVVNRARHTITEFEERLQSETEDIAKSIADTQARIEQIAEAAEAAEAARVLTETPEEPRDTTDVPVLSVHILGERSNGRNGTQPLFFGQIEMKADSTSFDYRLFKNLKKSLLKMPGMKHLQESASEKELSALFDITEPLPLIELLGKIPQVAEVSSRTDREIAVVFNNQG